MKAGIEQDKTLRNRPCSMCREPFGKWTCHDCNEALCNTCVVTHRENH